MLDPLVKGPFGQKTCFHHRMSKMQWMAIRESMLHHIMQKQYHVNFWLVDILWCTIHGHLSHPPTPINGFRQLHHSLSRYVSHPFHPICTNPWHEYIAPTTCHPLITRTSPLIPLPTNQFNSTSSVSLRIVLCISTVAMLQLAISTP